MVVSPLRIPTEIYGDDHSVFPTSKTGHEP
jgi:hypothetical protein